MSKVIHTAKHDRYVVEYQRDYFDQDEWNQWESFQTPEAAIAEANRQAVDEPSVIYRVVDTEADDE